ncbi:hypothetical protein V6N12_050283 [Hibiscus sabdariffa]|uniref:Uncharacterized protein n=1 Tax=Hibiscus sabdariffa TaxID=183260 RepID=A0ABR2GC09_9ROSI
MSTSPGILGADFPSLSESHGGRPLDALILPTNFSSLERHGSPVFVELQPANKKGGAAEPELEQVTECRNKPVGGQQLNSDNTGGVEVMNRGKGTLVTVDVVDPSCSIIGHNQGEVEQGIIEKT